MQFQPASLASLEAFLLIVAGVIAMLFAGVWHSARKELGPQLGKRYTLKFIIKPAVFWLLFCLIIASGVVGQAALPLLPLVLVICLASGVAFALSPTGGMLAQNVPTIALMAFQGFRLPLELVLHAWVGSGTIPETMTWTGANPDIISGIVALAATPFVTKNRAVAWGANILGFALLLNVIRVAVMSSPLPFAWGVEPPLQLAFHLPYALIVPICVAGALAGHLILTRQLMMKL